MRVYASAFVSMRVCECECGYAIVYNCECVYMCVQMEECLIACVNNVCVRVFVCCV